MQAERGIADLLNAAESFPDVRFVFVGGHKNDLDLWRSAVLGSGTSNIKMLGYQPHDVVCEIQQASDILVASRSVAGRPSVTSPLKFFEYLLSGVPVIAPDIAALRRFAQKNLVLRYYDHTQPQTLVHAIRSELAEERRWPHRVMENIEYGMSYTWEARQRRLFDFIGSIDSRSTF